MRKHCKRSSMIMTKVNRKRKSRPEFPLASLVPFGNRLDDVEH